MDENLFTVDHKKGFSNPGNKQLTRRFCMKPGHFKQNCRKLAQLQRNEKMGKSKHSASQANAKEQVSSDDEALVVGHALSATSR